MSQVRLDVLYRTHALRLGRHRSAQDLEVQPLDSQRVRQRLEHPEPIVGGIQNAAVRVGEDEVVGRYVPTLHLPCPEFVSESFRKVLHRDNGERPAQRIVRLEQVLTPRYLGWLAHENGTGANVYVAANPLRSGSRRRTKESIASVRHLYIDIDLDGEARVAALRTSDADPAPTAILSTSVGKYQVLWRVEGFDFVHQEAALKQLDFALGGDPTCTDCNRVLRVPGFLNRKYSPAHPVDVEYPCDMTWNPGDFHFDDSLTSAVLPLRGIARPMQSRMQTHSEQDWAWVMDQLADDKDATKLTHALACRRADKPNPQYYAQRTVDMASARLWLLEGAPIDDVIAMLEVRRNFEFPMALCSARAREIAQTAQRGIVRKKIA